MTSPSLAALTLFTHLAVLGSAAVAAPAPDLPASEGHRLALVIGTSRYLDRAWPHLPNASTDAIALGDELAHRYGYRVERLIDPTLETLKHRLRTFSQAAGPHDDLFIFIAGHGHLDPVDRAGSLVLSDASEGCRTGCYPFDHLKRALYDVPARHVLVTLDTCHAGAVDPATAFGGEVMRSGPTLDLAPAQVSRALREYQATPSRLVFASTTDRPTSDGPPGEHSPFMRVLLRELAAPGPSGLVTLDRLYAATQREAMSSAMRPVAFAAARPHHPNGTFIFVEDTDLCRSLARLTDSAARGLTDQAFLEPTRVPFGAVSATRGGLPGASDCRLWRLDSAPPVLRCEFGEGSAETAWARQDQLTDQLTTCLSSTWSRHDIDHGDLRTRARHFTSEGGVRVSTLTVCENRCTVSVTLEPP